MPSVSPTSAVQGSSRNIWRPFLLHLLLFALLPGLLLLAGEVVLQTSGEVWPLPRVTAYQRAHPDSLFLRSVDQLFYAYKYRRILESRPSVLIAGSSRTMKFRAPMFGDRANSFYNAGGILNSLRDLHDFSVTLPSSVTPAVLLIGLDPWWFNERVAPAFSFADEISKGAGFSFDEHVMALRWLFVNPQVLVHQARLALGPDDNRAIGIAARETGGGFRLDGSHQSRLPTPRTEQEWAFVDRETPPVIERVRSGTGNFPPATSLSRDRVALLDEVLAAYQTRHVLVIGYLPPFSSEVLAQLESDPRHRFFWADFRREMPELLARHGFPLFDASATTAVGLDDRAMSDGFHAEETFQARVVRALLDDERIRAALPGTEAVLDRALASPRTNYWQPDFGR